MIEVNLLFVPDNLLVLDVVALIFLILVAALTCSPEKLRSSPEHPEQSPLDDFSHCLDNLE